MLEVADPLSDLEKFFLTIVHAGGGAQYVTESFKQEETSGEFANSQSIVDSHEVFHVRYLLTLILCTQSVDTFILPELTNEFESICS